MLLFCFWNEYISLQMKEIYKMIILEEIILVLNDVNKKSFQIGHFEDIALLRSNLYRIF